MSSTDATGAPPAVALSAADVGAMRQLVEGLDPALPGASEGDGPLPGLGGRDGHRPGLGERECIDLLRELEDLKAAAAGAQVAVTAHLSRLRLDAEQAAGVAADRRGRGLGSEVASHAASPRTTAAGTSAWPGR